MSKLTPRELEAARRHYEHYHDSVVSNPSLYAYDGHLTVRLMDGLRSRCNAAAGHDGQPGNYRAIGIRVTSDDPRKELTRIYASFDSFVHFVESSDCRGLAEAELANVNAVAIKIAPLTWAKVQEAMLDCGVHRKVPLERLPAIRDHIKTHLSDYATVDDAIEAAIKMGRD